MDAYLSIPPAKNLTTLTACQLIEECCAKIYRRYTVVFGDRPECVALWKQMAEDEDSHAEKFKQAVEKYGDTPRCVNDDNYLIESIVDHLNALIGDLDKNPPALRDALLTSAILEHSLEKYHVATGALLVDDELKKLLTEMAHNDQCHRELLECIDL